MLSEQTIQKLKVADKPKKYADGGGLFLFIPMSGKKLWRMAYRFEQKAKLLTFGEYPQVSLLVARKRRDEAKALLKSGIDPSAYKKATKQEVVVEIVSFRNVALEWYEQQTLHCEKAYRSFLLKSMTDYFFPTFGNKAMSDVTAQDILTAIAPLQQSQALRNGRRLTDVCGQICRYAVATGKAEQDASRQLPSHLRSKQDGHRAALLDDAKLGQILLNLEQHSGYFPVGCALRLVPLLFVRSGDLRCAAWSEFDFSRKLWLIPAKRMLTKREHIVPLSKQTIKILKELKEYSGRGALLFPGVHAPNKPIDISTITVSLRKRGYDGVKLSFDGIRSLAARLLAERGYTQEIIALQLAHHHKSKVSFDYKQYLSERKTMMQDWSDYLFTLKNKALQENIQGGDIC